MRSPQVSQIKDPVISREEVWVRSKIPLTKEQHLEAQDYAYHYGAHEVTVVQTLSGYSLQLSRPTGIRASLRRLYDYLRS